MRCPGLPWGACSYAGRFGFSWAVGGCLLSAAVAQHMHFLQPSAHGPSPQVLVGVGVCVCVCGEPCLESLCWVGP